MKILRKLFITIPLIIVVLLIGAVVLIGLFADRAVKLGIEKGGSAELTVAVKVGDADLSIFGGKLALRDLIIENPQGYKNENLLELETGSVGVNIRSLLSDTVKINHITLDGAVVVLEQKDLLHNNIKDILQAMPKDPEVEGQTAGGAKRLHIDRLVVTNTTVRVTLPGRIDFIPFKLEPIEETDLGSDSKLTTARLTVKILLAIFRGITEQGKGILPDNLLNGISGALGETFEAGIEAIKEGAETGKKLLEGVEDTGKKLGEGLQGLLPGKKKDE